MAEPISRLDAAVVERTAQRLASRIHARFPTRDLGRVAEQLQTLNREIARNTASERWLAVLRLVCRTLVAVLAISVPVLLLTAVTSGLDTVGHTTDWLQIAESLVNDLVFTGIAILFLWALPARVERDQALKMTHRLRGLAHVIDMHQLTKDPDRFRPDFIPTAQTEDPGMTPIELATYLNYCSELLSLVGKTAALLAEDNSDPTVLSAVSNVETLCSDLSRQIWQKIALLPTLGVQVDSPGAAAG